MSLYTISVSLHESLLVGCGLLCFLVVVIDCCLSACVDCVVYFVQGDLLLVRCLVFVLFMIEMGLNLLFIVFVVVTLCACVWLLLLY